MSGPLLVGRDVELSRLQDMLGLVPVALVYGVAGVGKSTLAHAFAGRWTAGPVAYHNATASESLGSLVDELRRQLAAGPVVEATDTAERLSDVARRLDETHALAVIDDLHVLSEAVRVELVRGLGRGLRRGRAVATSREIISRAAGDPDRLELRLSGLGETDARSLWRRLDELYGPAAHFTDAWGRVGGNPLLLRRAHAGDLDDDDPVAACVRSLSPDERRVAGAFALAATPLPAKAMGSALLPDSRAREALRALIRRLVVEPDGAGCFIVHDLFRDALQDALSADEKRAIHEALAELLESLTLDPVVRAREIHGHLIAIDRFEDAGRHLVRCATDFIRHGAVGELLGCIETIPQQRRSAELKVAHARMRGRQLDVEGAYDELAELVRDGSEPRAEIRISFGQFAKVTSHLDVGERALQELLADPALTGPTRLRAVQALAQVWTYQGRGEAARRLLREARTGTTDPVEQAELSCGLAYTLWIDELDEEGEREMRRVRPVLQQTTRYAVLAPAVHSMLLGRLGRIEEAEAALEQMERALAAQSADASRFAKAVLTATRASLCFERGEYGRALEDLRDVAERFDGGGDRIGALWARAFGGRILMILGRRHDATQLLDATERRARELGIATTLRAVEHARNDDPALALLREQAGHGAIARVRAMAAVRAARIGDAAQVHALLEANASVAVGPDHALDRAFGLLALATLARVEGRAKAARDAFEQAKLGAAEGQADLDLLPALRDALGRLRIVTPGSRWLASDVPATAESPMAGNRTPSAVILDGRDHTLATGRRRVSLKGRPTLRALLYALASEPGCVRTKEDLAAQISDGPYHPHVHDGALWTNVRRLRALLTGTGVKIELASNPVGYRLVVPLGFFYVDPDT